MFFFFFLQAKAFGLHRFFLLFFLNLFKLFFVRAQNLLGSLLVHIHLNYVI